MTSTPRKRTRATIVSPEAVEQATILLEELPEKPRENLSLREAVKQMQDSLKAALAKGYSYEELAQMLAKQGIQISAFTLKNYVPSGKRSITKGKTRKSKSIEEGDIVDIFGINGDAASASDEAPIKVPQTKGAKTPKAATPKASTTGTRGRRRG